VTFAELLLMLCLGIGLYRFLRPLRRYIELSILKAMGRTPKWIDADVVARHERKKE
jgi:hypothetical protein